MQATEALMRLEPIPRGGRPPAANAADPAKATDIAEAQLVHASVAGDEDAFAALVRRHQGRVFRLAGRFFRQPQDIEEVAQEKIIRKQIKNRKSNKESKGVEA